MERRKVHNYWKSKYLCNISILYYKLDIFLIFIKKSIFLSYIYKGHGVKGPIPHCRGLGGPPSPLQEDARRCRPWLKSAGVILISNKRKHIWKPSWSTLGMGEKPWTKISSLIKSPLCDLLCWFKLYLSAKIYCR